MSQIYFTFRLVFDFMNWKKYIWRHFIHRWQILFQFFTICSARNDGVAKCSWIDFLRNEQQYINKIVQRVYFWNTHAQWLQLHLITSQTLAFIYHLSGYAYLQYIYIPRWSSTFYKFIFYLFQIEFVFVIFFFRFFSISISISIFSEE